MESPHYKEYEGAIFRPSNMDYGVFAFTDSGRGTTSPFKAGYYRASCNFLYCAQPSFISVQFSEEAGIDKRFRPAIQARSNPRRWGWVSELCGGDSPVSSFALLYVCPWGLSVFVEALA